MSVAVCARNNLKYLAFALLAILVSACSVPKGTLFYGALGKGESVLIIANGVTGGPQAIAAYKADGTLLEILTDLTYDNLTPKGLAKMDAWNFVVALDGGSDFLAKVATIGGYSTFVNNSNFNGTIYQMAYDDVSKTYFTIETNTIEGFDNTGNRIQSGVNPVINTTVGSCVLATPRGLAIDSTNRRLFVTNGAANSLLVYDLTSASAPTCLRVNATMGNNVPVPVIVHSSGYVYSATQTAASRKIWAIASDGSGTATGVYTDVAGTVLNAPTAMVEMPDGTVLVANQGTAQIDRFTVSGTSAATRYGTTPFIKDAFTTNVNQMLIMQGL